LQQHFTLPYDGNCQSGDFLFIYQSGNQGIRPYQPFEARVISNDPAGSKQVLQICQEGNSDEF
jgi:hypothetical protein